jgi:hypothetical protein
LAKCGVFKQKKGVRFSAATNDPSIALRIGFLVKNRKHDKSCWGEEMNLIAEIAAGMETFPK